MFDLWKILLPLLVTDVLNPVLFAYLVYAVGSARPIANSAAALLGHTLAYFSAGIGLALGFDRISNRLANPESIDFLIEVVLGVLLIWIAIRMRGGDRPQNDRRESVLTPAIAFGYGAIVNFIGLPFALPYFAALDQILKTDLSAAQVVTILIVYNLLYALPFIVVPILHMALGERSRPILERINGWLDRAGAVVLPLMLGLVGLALLADAVTYFVAGDSLF